MCGIAFVLSCVQFELSSCTADLNTKNVLFSADDFELVLCRRGPESVRSKTVFLHEEDSPSLEVQSLSLLQRKEKTENKDLCLQYSDCFKSVLEHISGLHFIGSTLQLRGVFPVTQPLEDERKNILAYNGEIFGGVHVDVGRNDSEILLNCLGSCCYCEHVCLDCSTAAKKTSVPVFLSRLRGPWAIIYWQSSSRTLWFGRDAFGRRSLLVHWPNSYDPRLLLSSVSPRVLGSEMVNKTDNSNFWEELPCGVYSMVISSSKHNGFFVGEIKKHEWMDETVKRLMKWDRKYIEPECGELPPSQLELHGNVNFSNFILSRRVLAALKKAVLCRSYHNKVSTIQDTGNKINEKTVPVAVLFSGGLDSMIIAALLHQCLEPCYGIDLLNVSFDGESAPDRISAKAGLEELEQVFPLRRWKLVQIDADISELAAEIEHVMSLLSPANTYMDLNIGMALWLAASGDGWVLEKGGNNTAKSCGRVKYKSDAQILLVGSGADEQCGGYGRHRTKFKQGSWSGLQEEMRVDMQRIWKRNLGRDDRCISDRGKEARYPFLDEDVVSTLLELPLWDVVDLRQPTGRGDKKILREVARLLGLHAAAILPKRAIQFGCRIAQQWNRKNFGSNRAANAASAGSVQFFY